MPSSDPYAGVRWPLHGETCICFRCKALRRRLARLEEWEPRVRVASDETAEHIETLLGAGWRRIEIARAAGLSPAVITKAQRRGATLEETTAERILGLTVDSERGTRVEADELTIY